MKRQRYPKLPVAAGKAHQMLSAAILLGDHALAAWIDCVVLTGQVVGRAEAIEDLKRRLDTAMQANRPASARAGGDA